MFKVRHKETGEIRTVYGQNGTYFLFCLNGEWRYGPIEKYEPLEE